MNNSAMVCYSPANERKLWSIVKPVVRIIKMSREFESNDKKQGVQHVNKHIRKSPPEF